MTKIWPHDKIRELLALAETNGSAKAVLSSCREAELFRFAVYSFRRKYNTGQGIMLTIDNKTVNFQKRELLEVNIMQNEGVA
jgi:hypothetical protein